VFVRNLETNVTTRVSVAPGGVEANAQSSFPTLSGDGRFVAFESGATNLVAIDTNGQDDVFVVELATGTVQQLGQSADSDPTIIDVSFDGQLVAFSSSAALIASDTNAFDDIYVVNHQTNAVERVSLSNAGVQANGDSWPSHGWRTVLLRGRQCANGCRRHRLHDF